MWILLLKQSDPIKIWFLDLVLIKRLFFSLFPSGGALKPTDVDSLWVHVTCAWFQPEVSFASDEKMEPALGILCIPSNSFVKVEYHAYSIKLL